MNPRTHDALLRYASLSAAGLPATERHLAHAATRQRASRVVLDPGPAPCRGAIRFSVTVGKAAMPEIERGIPAPHGKRRLVLLSY